jgi:predicted membrane protein
VEHIILPKRKSDAISNGVFLITLGILFFTNSWWPGILLALWAVLVVRQYFTGRYYDLIITSIILLGLFVINYFNIGWDILMPVLFVIGGIYIIFREYFFSDDVSVEDKIQEIQEDIDLEYHDEIDDKPKR